MHASELHHSSVSGTTSRSAPALGSSIGLSLAPHRGSHHGGSIIHWRLVRAERCWKVQYIDAYRIVAWRPPMRCSRGIEQRQLGNCPLHHSDISSLLFSFDSSATFRAASSPKTGSLSTCFSSPSSVVLKLDGTCLGSSKPTCTSTLA